MNEHEITNANDVTLTIKGDNTSRAGADGKLMVADFDIEQSGDSELKHGVGNHDPIAVTHGNRTHNVDLTLEGEDAELFDDIYTDDGKPPDMQVTATGVNYKWIVNHFWPQDISYSGSDGDAVEVSLSGPSMKPNRERL